VIDSTGTTPLTTIKAQIKSAYGAGSWTGNGITSSTAAANAGAPHKTAVGYAEDSAIGSPTTFAGQSADTTSILLRYTYYGDANLDKKVDLTDFTFLAANFNGTSRFWSQGDFDYTGTVDLTDFTLLASNFNLILPDELAGGLGAAIPEPTSLALLFGLMALTGRRRSGCQI
jgi:hypothetical protein